MAEDMDESCVSKDEVCDHEGLENEDILLFMCIKGA